MMLLSRLNLTLFLSLFFVTTLLHLSGGDLRYNFPNYLISIFSIVFVSFGIELIRGVGIKAYNVFILAFFFPLFLNTLILSDRQIIKEYVDIYFLFVGPVLFLVVLAFFESVRVVKVNSRFRFINVEFLYLFLTFIFVFLKLYIGQVKGFKIFSVAVEGADLSFNAFALPGYSGVAGILQWVILMLSFCVRRKYRIFGICCLILFNSFLGVNRGDFTRTIAFLLLYQIFEISYYRGQFKEIFSKYKKMLIRLTLIFLLVFVAFGQLREVFQVREVALITQLLGSKVDSLIFAWLYSYFALGYDVLLLYVRAEYFGYVEYLTAFMNPSEKLTPPVSLTIWPFNQTTVLRGYVAAYGYNYYIPFILKAIVTGIFLIFAKLFNIKGLYVFVVMFLMFSFFSEYFLSRSILSAFVVVIFIYPFLKFRKDHGTSDNRY